MHSLGTCFGKWLYLEFNKFAPLAFLELEEKGFVGFKPPPLQDLTES